MRNLVILEHSTSNVEAELPLTAKAWDVDNNAVICAYGPTLQDQRIEIRHCHPADDAAAHQLLASWNSPSPNSDLEEDKIISLHNFSHTHQNSICLVLAGGDIIIVRGDPEDGQDAIEIQASVDAGISAATWSPDGDLLAIVSKANTLLFMTTSFDCVVNVDLSPDDVKISKHVSVGWGKKETQFHGKRAKALRDPTVPEHVDEGILSPRDDHQISISWRGDGAFVAVNAIELIECQERRIIRVYSREGGLDSVSEPVDGLLGALSWKPSGELITALQHKGQMVQVIFFERNGLRHGEFDLRLSLDDQQTWAKNVSLSWNVDSTVLAVAYCDRIQLWTTGNYHYYLKQEIRSNPGQLFNHSTCAIVWHPENAMTLQCHEMYMSDREVLEEPIQTLKPAVDTIHTIEVAFSVSSGSRISPNDIGMTAVVDGCTLKITPLRLANVPPPYAWQDIDMPNKIIDVAFSDDNLLIAVLHVDGITTLSSKRNKFTIDEFEILQTTPFPSTNSEGHHLIPAHIVLDKSHQWHLGSFAGEAPQNSSSSYCIHTQNSQGSQSINRVPCQPIRLMQDVACGEIHLLQNKDLQIMEIAEKPWKHLTQCSSTLPCSFPSSVVSADLAKIQDRYVAFGLTASGTMYANDRRLLRNCTSYVLTESHLIVTTSNHLLKFIHLTSDANDLEVPNDEPESDERCRNIERGAKLVAIMPTTYSVVLQMPRGNLETIYPRALVLPAIRRFVEAKDYKAAFMACRNQRVDMNIIHDHAPQQFLESIELFLQQLKSPSHIDLFLSQLSAEDVSETMYKETLPGKNRQGNSAEPSTPAAANDKVDSICNGFLLALKKQSIPNIKNIITAHLCKTKPDIVAGLTEIGRLQDKTAKEEAVEHICFLTDINRIYDTALGMYDLQMTLLVAQQSQKDPREYLPYLQGLQKLAQDERQFKINDHLGRQGKALIDLHAIADFERLQAYVQKHELYPQALELFKYDESHYQNILRLYADFLNGSNKYREAATAYESLGDFASASESYRSANMWRECLSCAAFVPVSPEKLTEIAESLADSLEEAKDYAAVACIYRDYLDDLARAVRYFCKAYKFSEAIGLVALRGQQRLLVDVVDPGIAESSATLTEMLTECKGQIAAQVPRLRELRTIKMNDPLAFFEGAEGPDIPDNVSLAPSATSTTGNTFMTRYTNQTGTIASQSSRKTSKNRRREERKRARGKKGSVYEEEYLVSSIGRLIERVNSIAEDVQNAVEACLRRTLQEQGKALEEVMKDVVSACHACIDEVFEVPPSQPAPVDEDSVERPAGGQGVLWDSLEQKHKRVVPVIKKFQENPLISSV